MDRGELEDLDRETLVVRAQAAGIRRARILTRPELIDELLRLDPHADAAQLKKSRGFFGRARDLVARVVERGLHLPDAADRIRTLALGTMPTSGVPRTEPQAMPTVTLAEIYAAQGHRQRAVETLRRVLEREPDHTAARALLARLEDEAYVAPKPRLPPEPDVEPELNPSDGDDDAVTVHFAGRAKGDDFDDAALTVETPIVAARAPIQGPSDSNGEYEFSLVPASDREPTRLDPAYAETREAQRAGARGYSFTADDVDAHAKTDVFAAVPPRASAAVPAAAATPAAPAAAAEVVEAPEVEECFAIPVARDELTEGAAGRMFVRWSISWSTIGALLGARPSGRFVVRAHVVTPAWDGPNAETRDLVVDPDDEQVMLVGLPEPSVVRVAVGWLDQSTFVPVAHSPALEMSGGRGLVIWTSSGAVPVVLDDPRAASIARAVAASKVAAQAHA
ncbi:MAG: hypothetical protein JWO86_2105 [Myxococcaceae bacterium]|nr:hypothetical protein [Myxococcaceae bacterium]